MSKGTEKSDASSGREMSETSEIPDMMPDTSPEPADSGKLERQITKSPEAALELKSDLLGSVSHSRGVVADSLIGSKSVPSELGRVKDAYAGFYRLSIGSTFQALKDLVTLHPVRAVKEYVFGTTGNLKNMADIATAIPRLAIAGIADTGRTIKTAVVAPFKATGKMSMKALEKADGWVNRLGAATKRLTVAHA